MQSSSDSSSVPVTKRKEGDDQSEPRKKRASYALRACDACKKRKGKCNGRQPCQFCEKRGIECHYADHHQLGQAPEEEPGQVEDTSTSGDGMESGGKTAVSNAEKARKLRVMIKSLQKQLDKTASELGTQEASGSRDQNQFSHSDYPGDCSYSASSKTTESTEEPRNISRYQGPSSSEYGLNIASMTLSQIKDESDPRYTIMDQPILDLAARSVGNIGAEETQKRGNMTFDLTQCCNKPELLRLLGIYQRVVGDLHPIVNMVALCRKVELLYSKTDGGQTSSEITSRATKDMLLQILTLTCSIALFADGQSKLGHTLFESVYPSIQAAISSHVDGLLSVTLLLLASIFHYFDDETWLAWRFCGIAGRMIMELGMNYYESFDRSFSTQLQRDEASGVLWSIIIFDRLWSCNLGLPQNFRQTDFDESLPVPTNAPYLKAMSTYAMFSPQHWNPEKRTMIEGLSDIASSFDILTFETEQWRIQALTGLQFIHPRDRRNLTTEVLPDSVATLLYLRANQSQVQLIRPFFFTDVEFKGRDSLAKVGMGYILDTIDILYDLDATTDFYRTQLPLFRHFLASSIALLLLIIAKLPDTSGLGSNSLDQESYISLNEGITLAKELALKYEKSSKASLRTWQRIRSLLGCVSNVGKIQRILQHQSLSMVPLEAMHDFPSNLLPFSSDQSSIMGSNQIPMPEESSQLFSDTVYYNTFGTILEDEYDNQWFNAQGLDLILLASQEYLKGAGRWEVSSMQANLPMGIRLHVMSQIDPESAVRLHDSQGPLFSIGIMGCVGGRFQKFFASSWPILEPMKRSNQLANHFIDLSDELAIPRDDS